MNGRRLPLLRAVRTRLQDGFEFQFQPGLNSSGDGNGTADAVTGAMAREILVSDEGKAQGVSYVDKATRREQRVRAKAVVVAGSSCESARLLLNSRSPRFPRVLPIPLVWWGAT